MSTASSDYTSNALTPQEYWRAIVLYGANTVDAFQAGELSEMAAIDRIARQGFGDVVPRFHTVNGAPVPQPFYEQTTSGLVLTDTLLSLFGERPRPDLQAEVASRWDLLEAAFAMHLPTEVLDADEQVLYRASRTNRTDRVNITGTRPVLNGYQNGLCFYCDEPFDAMDWASVHVDHVIPRTFLQHDAIWNLVLAHDACNLAKSARLPALPFLERLYERNEHYIASHHPIRRRLIEQMGATAQQRRVFMLQTYSEARRRLVHIWDGTLRDSRREHPLAALEIAPTTRS